MKLITVRLQRGMTLLEILVTLAIIGILASIAVPTVSHYLIKSERSRVQTDLYQLQLHAEQFYTLNGNYPDNASLICGKCQVSDEYTFSIIAGSGDSNVYIIKATPKTTSLQHDDTECYSMAVNAAFMKLNYSVGGMEITDNSKCWI